MKPSAPTKRSKFPGKFRLKHRSDFLRLQSKGEKLYAKHFLVSIAPGATPDSRLGIAVTKKVAPRAVDRNRVKRRVKEIFRRYRHLLKGNFDIVVVARREAHLCSFTELQAELLGPLMKSGYLTKEAL